MACPSALISIMEAPDLTQFGHRNLKHSILPRRNTLVFRDIVFWRRQISSPVPPPIPADPFRRATRGALPRRKRRSLDPVSIDHRVLNECLGFDRDRNNILTVQWLPSPTNGRLFLRGLCQMHRIRPDHLKICSPSPQFPIFPISEVNFEIQPKSTMTTMSTAGVSQNPRLFRVADHARDGGEDKKKEATQTQKRGEGGGRSRSLPSRRPDLILKKERPSP